MSRMVLTYRYRVKNAKGLLGLASRVNLVWNYCGGVQKQASQALRRWPSAFDLIQLTRASRKIGLHSDAIAAVCFHFARSRDAKKSRPRWRKSLGAKRSLGWIPFNAARAIRMDGDAVIFQKAALPSLAASSCRRQDPLRLFQRGRPGPVVCESAM